MWLLSSRMKHSACGKINVKLWFSMKSELKIEQKLLNCADDASFISACDAILSGLTSVTHVALFKGNRTITGNTPIPIPLMNDPYVIHTTTLPKCHNLHRNIKTNNLEFHSDFIARCINLYRPFELCTVNFEHWIEKNHNGGQKRTTRGE